MLLEIIRIELKNLKMTNRNYNSSSDFKTLYNILKFIREVSCPFGNPHI